MKLDAEQLQKLYDEMIEREDEYEYSLLFCEHGEHEDAGDR